MNTATLGRGEVSEAVRRAAWIARDFELISIDALERVFSRTVDAMKREDLEDLASAMKQLASVLYKEARNR